VGDKDYLQYNLRTLQLGNVRTADLYGNADMRLLVIQWTSIPFLYKNAKNLLKWSFHMQHIFLTLDIIKKPNSPLSSMKEVRTLLVEFSLIFSK
jgi:hypothetical protein